MLPSLILSTAPGVPSLLGGGALIGTAVAPVGADFAALLPAGTVPIVPRQADAEGGKDLPATGNEDEELAGDAVLAWITPPLWPAVSPPAAAPTGEAATSSTKTGGTVLQIVAPQLDMMPTSPSGELAAKAETSHGEGSGLFGVPRHSGTTSAGELEVTPVATVTATSASNDAGEGRGTVTTGPMLDSGLHRSGAEVETTVPTAQPDAPPRITAAKDPAAPIVAPAPAAPQLADPAQPARIAPAAQIFAVAIHQVIRDERRADAPDPTITGIAPTTDLTAHAVAAGESSRHAALDMGRETWPAKMIERIEMMRDAVDAVDTSIRLVPDKLGAIDVSLRRDGDAVAVQFTAQQPETRQLLSEAQPKLAELAEAKGLKLSAQLGDGHGNGQHQQQQRAPSSAAHSTTTQSARTASNDDAALADERIA